MAPRDMAPFTPASWRHVACPLLLTSLGATWHALSCSPPLAPRGMPSPAHLPWRHVACPLLLTSLGATWQASSSTCHTPPPAAPPPPATPPPVDHYSKILTSSPPSTSRRARRQRRPRALDSHSARVRGVLRVAAAAGLWAVEIGRAVWQRWAALAMVGGSQLSASPLPSAHTSS